MTDQTVKVYITNVCRGKDERNHMLYAEVRSIDDDSLLIAATLDYCIDRVYNTRRIDVTDNTCKLIPFYHVVRKS